MKNISLTVLLFASATLAYGQTFAPSGAQWHYGASANGAAPTGSEYYHYQSQLDTVVAGHSCKKITITYYQYSGAITYPASVFTYQIGDTVFYYNNIYSKYFPLYIFGVLPGDTLFYHSPVIPGNPADTLFKVLVDSVTTLVVDVTPLKRVWTTPLGDFSLGQNYTELIGSDWLMLHQPSAVFPEWDGPARCYSDSNIEYHFTLQSCNYLLTNGISELENTFGLLVFPNPTTNRINIQTSNKQKFTFNIHNSVGQLVKTGILETNSTTIYINELINGIYTIELAHDGKMERKCFIVEK